MGENISAGPLDTTEFEKDSKDDSEINAIAVQASSPASSEAGGPFEQYHTLVCEPLYFSSPNLTGDCSPFVRIINGCCQNAAFFDPELSALSKRLIVRLLSHFHLIQDIYNLAATSINNHIIIHELQHQIFTAFVARKVPPGFLQIVNACRPYTEDQPGYNVPMPEDFRFSTTVCNLFCGYAENFDFSAIDEDAELWPLCFSMLQPEQNTWHYWHEIKFLECLLHLALFSSAHLLDRIKTYG